MSGDCGNSLRLTIDINGMTAAFTQELAAMRFQMAYQIAAFHAAETESGSRMTVWPRSLSSVSSRFASKTRVMAS